MVLPETILASIKKDREVKDLVLLNEAHTSIHTSLKSGNSDRVGLNVIVLCAEAALELGAIPTADDCLKTYDLEARRYESQDAQVKHRFES